MRPFQITRTDGRSNGQVLIDYLRDGEPGRVYPYPELMDALSAGANRAFDASAVRGIVAAIYPRLLKEQERALHSVRGVGYRLAYAREHAGLTRQRFHRSDVQAMRGLQTLRHVRWEELSSTERALTEGFLMLAENQHAQSRAFDRRLRAVENAIKAIAPGGEQVAG